MRLMENHTFRLIINKVRLKKQKIKIPRPCHRLFYNINMEGYTQKIVLLNPFQMFSSNAVMTFVRFCIKMAVAMD